MKTTGGLLSISCGNYLNLRAITCARADALAITTSLLKKPTLYEVSKSFSLDDPSYQEIRNIFSQERSALKDLDLLSIYFSGHGDVHEGSFYLCPCDYNPEMPSAFGFPISELIRFCRDLKVKVLNIIIDACQAGHASKDLRESLERPATENESAMCISILASSVSGQSSYAGARLSAFTSDVVDLISGSKDSETDREFISLSDVARCVRSIVITEGITQNVVHYSLNVLGAAYFCSNSLFKGARQPHNKIVGPESGLGRQAIAAKENLQGIYSSILKREFSHRALINTVRNICDNSSHQTNELDELLNHYNTWFRQAPSKVLDWSLPLRIAGSMAVASLKVGWEMKGFLENRILDIALALSDDLRIFSQAVELDEVDQLGIGEVEGLNSLYFRALAISEIYARLGLCILFADLNYLPREEVFLTCQKMVGLLLQQEEDNHIIINEIQSYHLGIFFEACASTNQSSLAEISFGLYFNDHVKFKGNVLRENCNASAIVAYAGWRVGETKEINYDGIAIPNTVLPVLMQAAKKLDLEDVVDPYLQSFNSTMVSFFLPQDDDSFGDENIRFGVNVTRAVGRDFYRLNEFCVDVDSEHRVFSELGNALSAQGLLKLVASFIYPNRFPWFS